MMKKSKINISDEAIMLIKSFRGSFVNGSEDNIPHEIINFFNTDNNETFLYVPPYGGYDIKRKINYVLITTAWENKKTEVLYLAKVENVDGVHGNQVTNKNREKAKEEQRKYIENNNIKYGEKYLYEIRMEYNDIKEEDMNGKVYYLTFKVTKLFKPKNQLYISWNPSDKRKENICYLKGKVEKEKGDKTIYNYQRQKGYITKELFSIKNNKKVIKNNADYEELINIINDKQIWIEAANQSININDKKYDDIGKKIDLLDLIDKEHDEQIYTNMIYSFFNENTRLLTKFVNEVLKIRESGNNIKIYKELSTTKLKEIKGINDDSKEGRMDLFIESDENLIVIENKIKSNINGVEKDKNLTQLSAYWNLVEKIKNIKEKGVKAHYFLLMPNYNIIKLDSAISGEHSGEYKPKLYKEIYDFLVKINPEEVFIEKSKYKRYFDDFISAIYKQSFDDKEIIERRFVKAIKKVN